MNNFFSIIKCKADHFFDGLLSFFYYFWKLYFYNTANLMNLKSLLPFGLSLCALNGVAAGLSYDFESNSDDWSGRGAATVELSSDQKHGGEKSLYVSNRTSSWHGALFQNDYLQAGKTYTFDAWVFSTENATIDMSMQYTADGSNSYPSICSKQVYAYSWTELSGEIVIPEDVTGIQPYFQVSGNASLSFYVDDVTCEEKVEEEADFSDQPSLKEVFKDYFKIGTAATASEITPANTKKLILHHFNSLTPGNELKPDCLLDQTASISDGNNVNPQVKLAASTKTVLKFCSENNIPIRGHVMVWHSQTPDWFFNENFASDGAVVSKDIMDQRMENYIKNVVEAVTSAYPNLQIYAWDIVNETFKNGEGSMRDPGSNYTTDGASKWIQVYGDSTFIYKAFKAARKYIPTGCKIYYNDYNEYIPSKRDGIYTLVKNLYDLGLCDGVGMQSHLSTSYPSVDLYKQAVAKFATIGCDIQITELDITLADGATYDTQATEYKALFDIYKEYKDNISLVCFWGTNDETSWRASGEPLIYANYKPKTAYWKIIEDMPTTSTANVGSEKNVKISSNNAGITVAATGKFSYSVSNVGGQVVSSGLANNSISIALPESNDIYVINVIAENGARKSVKVVR